MRLYMEVVCDIHYVEKLHIMPQFNLKAPIYLEIQKYEIIFLSLWLIALKPFF